MKYKYLLKMKGSNTMNRSNGVSKEFNKLSKREIQRAKQRAKQGWRPMTEEEKAYANELFEKERKRYETNLKIGGIDERGNYTRLSDRAENTSRYGRRG